MESTRFNQGDVVFRQGEREHVMYEILSGTVGIYKDYGTAHENKIAVLGEGDFIGEMELIESSPRSATGVVLSESAELRPYTDDNYLEFFETNPVQVYLIMKQLSERLRQTTQEYTEACRVIHEALAAASSREEPSPGLVESMKKFSGIYREMAEA